MFNQESQTMHPFADKFELLKRLGQMALLGVGLAVVALMTVVLHGPALVARMCGMFSAVFIAPVVFYFVVLPIFHWKARYRGSHSDGWGVLLLLQFSGWSAVIYFFRHILPDMRRTGRYASETDASQSGSVR